jgi:Tfp pilus assembly protein PilX
MRAIVRPANLTQSRGIALIAGLLLMASMVVLALAVATGMLLERRMAANFSDAQLALQRAQLADKWAGYWLLSRPNNPLDPACNDSCGPSPPLFGSGQLPDPPELEDTGWWQLHAQIAGIEPVTGQVQMDYSLPGTEDARWLIQEMHSQPLEGYMALPGAPHPTLSYYRVLGRGSGRFPGSIAVTETIVARPWAAEFLPALHPPAPDAEWFCEQVPIEVPCGRLGWRRRR